MPALRLNRRASELISNLSYSVSSNLVSISVSVIVVLVLPKILGVLEYGYFQLFAFYSSYVGFLQFGWSDGIYLRYGGREYQTLDRRLFSSQFWMLFASQILLGIGIVGAAVFLFDDVDRLFVVVAFSVAVVLLGVRAMPLFVLQATGRIRDYARSILVDRGLYLGLITFVIAIGLENYRLIVAASLLSSLLSLLYCGYLCRDFVTSRSSGIREAISEAVLNMSVGVKLMFSNVASLLIIGVVRFGIERSWGVEAFGKTSLMLNVSSLVLAFVNSVGIVMFPVLRRTSSERWAPLYLTFRTVLAAVLYGALLAYFPFMFVMSVWLPEYSDAFRYMLFVFPVFVFEGKQALLVNTFLKALRREKVLLSVNMTSLFLSVVMTAISTSILHSLLAAIVSILVLVMFRTILAEWLLSRVLRVGLWADTVLEVTLTTAFLAFAWFLDSWLCVVGYSLAFLIYLVLKRRDLRSALGDLRAIFLRPESLDSSGGQRNL